VPNIPTPQPSNPRDDLASLHFDAIKILTFRGAMRRVLDPFDGAPAYLESIRRSAQSFAAAAEALSAAELARVGWPALPTGLLVEEIRLWWDQSRPAWSRRIHGFYRTVGRGAVWPIRTAWNFFIFSGKPVERLDVFHRQERAAIVLAVEKLLEELDRLSQVGNAILRPRLQKLLGGQVRADLLARVQQAHDQLPPVDRQFRETLWTELDAWRLSNPRAARVLQALDHAAALARPAITVGLFFTGLHLAGDLAGQAAAASAGHAATEAAIAGGFTGGGEAILGGAGEGIRQSAGRLLGRLQGLYARRRAAWLADWLDRELLGDLTAQLRRGAEAAESKEFQEAVSALDACSGGT